MAVWRRWLALGRRIGALEVSVHAANAGFFVVLSTFPALVLLLGLLRFTHLEVEALTQVLAPMLPDALEPGAEALILEAYRGSSRAVVGLSAVAGLWSASRGVYGLMTGLNAAYGVRETRSWLRRRLICMAYTLAFLLMLLLSLVIHVLGTTLALLPGRRDPLLGLLGSPLVRYGLGLGVQVLFFCLVYRVLPSRQSSLGQSFPGALAAGVGWTVFSDLFSLYVEYFPRYSSIFGSVYALALGMLWLYFCLSLLFYGGALNRWLEQRQKEPPG